MRTLRKTAARREREERIKRPRLNVREEPLCHFDYTPDVNSLVRKALLKGKTAEIVCNVDGIDLYGRDLQTLKKTEWVNDSVVDAYMKLIEQRSRLNPGRYPKIYCFSSFFYPRLQLGYDKVQRWTAKIDIFENDLLLFPIHSCDHWSILTLDWRDRTFTYYDSMRFDEDDVLEAPQELLKLINDYLEKEAASKGRASFKKIDECRTLNYPYQTNELDCGIFMLTYAEFRSLDLEPVFDQKVVPKLRRRMVYELASKRLGRDAEDRTASTTPDETA